ncbi:hypothetical protein HN51_011986 [Arachis hypogaea]|uniref:3'-5' exonuclease-like n=1 Tax=Arachis duranensis TaxID=130453 RepID=A0A6P4CNV5_ARADU|nr:3'-5' exonuclease-like [Arachis duranensis]XP_025676720.1 Werner Syndrome-like exonuclease [Arachis hypogaea]QHO57394.1 Werner Syndrome-like exonuclease [Arachis hypogaea]
MYGSPSSSPSIKSYRGISGASSIELNPNTSKYTITLRGAEIETTVTDKSTVVDQWVQDMNALYATNSSIVVGVDVERCAIRNKSATLNLCINKKCLIVQLFYIDNLPVSLKNFLMNPNFFFAGFEFANDIPNIKKEYGLNFCVHADIKKLALEKCRNWWSDPPSLKDIAEHVVRLEMKKPKLVSLSNWGARVLSIEQVEYGCIDAFVCSKIGHVLLRDD